MTTEKQNLITIVVPVLNRAHLIVRTLDSIAAQTMTGFRLIIVDNGSTDNTVEIIEKWIKAHSGHGFHTDLLHEPSKGASKARNRGLEATDTPYVMFFDSDDEMRPDHIERITKELTAFPDTDILRWDVATIDSDGWSRTQSKRFHDEMQLHLLHATMSTVRYIVRTDIARNVGGWDESLSTFDDLEFGVRILDSAEKIRKLHCEPPVLIHPTEESISGTNYSCRHKEIDLAIDRIEQFLKNRDRLADLRILNCRRAILASLFHREGNPEPARGIMNKAFSNTPETDHFNLRVIYHLNRLFGHGGSLIALKFMGTKPQKR